jgi:hypothetical protein
MWHRAGALDLLRPRAVVVLYGQCQPEKVPVLTVAQAPFLTP